MITYRLPAEPSRHRVAVWRELRRLGAVSPDRGGVFDYLLWMARLGGPVAGGRQYVSWIHDRDFVRAAARAQVYPGSGPVAMGRAGSAIQPDQDPT